MADRITVQIEKFNGRCILTLARSITVYEVRTYMASDFHVYPLQVDLVHVGPDGSITSLEKEDVQLQELAGRSTTCIIVASVRRIDTILEIMMRAVSKSQLPGMAQRNSMNLATSLLKDTLRSYTSAMIEEAAKRKYVTESVARTMSSNIVSGKLSMEAIRLRIIADSHVERPFETLTQTYGALVTRTVDQVLKIAPSIEANRVHAQDLRHGNDQGYVRTVRTGRKIPAPSANRQNVGPYTFQPSAPSAPGSASAAAEAAGSASAWLRQDKAPCTTSAPGSASAAEASWDALD